MGGAVIVFSELQALSLSILQGWLSRLPVQDRLRAQAMKNERRFRQFVVGRTLLQRGLTEFLGLSLVLTLTERGKPEHELAAVSLSHSGNWVAVVLALKSATIDSAVKGVRCGTTITTEFTQLGIDVEVYKSRNYMRLARHYFSVREVEKLECLNGVERQRYFNQLWVLKESLAKYLGSGLNSDLLASEFVAVGADDAGIKVAEICCQYIELDQCALALTANITGPFESFKAVAHGDECVLNSCDFSFESWRPKLSPV